MVAWRGRRARVRVVLVLFCASVHQILGCLIHLDIGVAFLDLRNDGSECSLGKEVVGAKLYRFRVPLCRACN